MIHKFFNKSDFLKELDIRIAKIIDDLKEYAPEQVRTEIEQFKEFALRPGKRLRPLMFFYSYLGYNGSEEFLTDAYNLSALLEIMHAFLLVHDDVMDNSDLRRSQPTLHKIYSNGKSQKYGENVAIVIGDTIGFYAFKILTQMRFPNIVEIINTFSECYINTGIGQLLDIKFSETDSIPDSPVPFEISRLKTSHYTFYYPILLGYKCAGLNDAGEMERIKSFGENIGIAFQFIDDYIGVFDPNINKSMNDIVEKKMTFLITETYSALSSGEKESFRRIFLSEKGDKEIDYIKQKIVDAEVDKKLKEVAFENYKKAFETLESLSLEAAIKNIISDTLRIYFARFFNASR